MFKRIRAILFVWYSILKESWNNLSKKYTDLDTFEAFLSTSENASIPVMDAGAQKLSDLEYAKVALECNHQEKAFSEVRSSSLADDFTKLEVQIAAILFAFVGIFAKFVDTKYAGYPDYGVFSIKLMFAVIIFSLTASLILGLIELKMKESFWNELMKQKLARYEAWMRVLRDEKFELKEAEAVILGTKHGTGLVRSTKKWPWILQTITLGIGAALILILFLIFISQSYATIPTVTSLTT